MSGVYSFHVLIEGAPDAMETLDAVRRIDRLAAAIGSLPPVRKATSMADLVKRANQELHEGKPDQAIVPQTPASSPRSCCC